MKNADPHQSSYPPEYEEFLNTYLLSELSPEETVVFELQLEKNPSLKKELEQRLAALKSIKEWIGDNPPGEEKLENLEIPQVSGKVHSLRKGIPFFKLSFRFLAWQGLVAAIVFSLGFILGQKDTEKVSVPPPAQIRQTQSPSTFSGPEKSNATDSLVPHESIPSIIAKQPDEDSSRKESSFIPTQYTTEKDGKLIVETTLKNSGARALWVVDGNFELDSETQDPDSKI